MSGSIRASLLTALGALLVAAPGRAQVNVEPVRKQLDESGFGVRLRLSIAAYQGNTEGIVTGASALAGGRTERHLGFLQASGDYAHFDSETSVKRTFVHLRHNYRIRPVLWWEEFAQSETDQFRRIRFRGLLGTGPRVAILQSELIDVYYGTSYMLEYTSVDAGGDQNVPSVGHRWNNYVAVAYRPDERITLSSVMYVQPRFDRFSDVHLLNVSSLEFKVTERLQSRMDATTRYETVTPENVQARDFELKSSLELKF